MQNRTETCEMSLEEQIQEAHKLYRYAKRKLTKGDFTTAEKALHKAERLYSTPHAKKLLCYIKSKSIPTKNPTAEPVTENRQSSKENNNPQTSKAGEEIRRHRSSSHRSVDLDYTKDQLEAVRRVFKFENYYKILDVMPNASVAEIKEAYKKQALLVHPDKNKAPGANQAFQAVGKAKEVLEDPLSRKKYDKQQQQQNISASTLSETSGFDTPTWLVVGGAALVVAGLFGAWWVGKSKTKSSEQSNHDEEMEQN